MPLLQNKKSKGLDMILTNKGYSVIGWSLVLAAVIAVLAISQDIATKAFETKMFQTAKYVLWSSWGDKEDLTAGSDIDNMRSQTVSDETRKFVRHEGHSGEIKTYLNPEENRIVTNRTVISTGDSLGESLDDKFLDDLEGQIFAPKP